ncbi:MAG: HAMP domain-containing protein [Sphingobacteriales bacterium]|nr:MAG: HAMP domain-containing protein [Sphingobacteriales bacterium]
MKIKDRLSINFTLISTAMLFVVLTSVYIVFLKFLEADFYSRLTDRTMVTAELYLEADEISRDELNKVRNRYLEKLSDEVIRIYDVNNKPTFIGDRAQYWTSATIQKVREAGKIKFKDGDNQVVGIYYKDNQGDFVILASATDQSSHKRLNKLAKIMISTFIVFFALLLLSGRWIAARILSPLRLFMLEVKKVGSSNLEFRVKESNTTDEIGELAKSFNQLLEELEQAFILQRTFVANASHELRTPITSVMMSAELTLSKNREISQYKETLASILEDTEKINSIITGLLTLAKADLELASAHLSRINLSEVIYDLKEDWQKRGNEVKVQNAGGDSAILANKVLLTIAINNIISNGFKFSNNQNLICLLRASPRHVILEISDKGIGIAEGELGAIFKPFYSRSEEAGKQGEGMGLYMASKIVTLFKGEIKIQSKIGEGTTFTLLFPKF